MRIIPAPEIFQKKKKYESPAEVYVLKTLITIGDSYFKFQSLKIGIIRQPLGSRTSIRQITFFMAPFLQSAVIKHFQIILNNKRNNIIVQALFEHNQSADTAVVIWE